MIWGHPDEKTSKYHLKQPPAAAGFGKPYATPSRVSNKRRRESWESMLKKSLLRKS